MPLTVWRSGPKRPAAINGSPECIVADTEPHMAHLCRSSAAGALPVGTVDSRCRHKGENRL